MTVLNVKQQAQSLVEKLPVWSLRFTPDIGGESVLTLKRDGDKLSGKYNAGKPGEADIQHGRFRNSEVSFEIERERDGDKTTNFYRGKFSGEDITGRSITDFGGRVRTNEWRAVRADYIRTYMFPPGIFEKLRARRPELTIAAPVSVSHV